MRQSGERGKSEKVRRDDSKAWSIEANGRKKKKERERERTAGSRIKRQHVVEEKNSKHAHIVELYLSNYANVVASCILCGFMPSNRQSI